MWKLSHIYFWRHICAILDIEKNIFGHIIVFYIGMKNHCRYLFDFTKKNIYQCIFKNKLRNKPCKYNYDLWVTYIKIKNGVYKIVLGGSSILNFFYNAVKMPNSYSSWSAKGSLFSHMKTPPPSSPNPKYVLCW